MLPETVKVANIQDAPSAGGTHYYEVPIHPGKGEIALLLAVNWQIYLTAVNACYAVLWRKSWPKTSSVSLFNQAGFKSPDVIDYNLFSTTQATAVGVWKSNQVSYKVYPYPIVLLRPPQLVMVNSVAGAGGVVIQCYYLIQKVSSNEMNRLLAKDHD